MNDHPYFRDSLPVSGDARHRLELDRRFRREGISSRQEWLRLLAEALDLPSSQPLELLSQWCQMQRIVATDLGREAGTMDSSLLKHFRTHFPATADGPGDAAWPAAALTAELVVVAALNLNPAGADLRALFEDDNLRQHPLYRELVHPAGGPGDRPPPWRSVLEQLLVPARKHPDSLAAQVTWMRHHWRNRLAADTAVAEAAMPHIPAPGPTGGGPAQKPGLGQMGIGARFSRDADWMAETVLIAKTLPVWMAQLARRFDRPIRTLDDIPDAALEELTACGFTALWPIGLWQRSGASRRIKQLRGNRDAAASAYALFAYRVDPELGGEEAFDRFRSRCRKAGLRLCGDLVPNHFGLDSEWVRQHPERFIQTAKPPFPAYRFTGPDLSADPDIELQIEDGYWDHSDAAVVFRHHDRRTGRTRYIYHGNDGTHLPWNDTAQLDYLQPEVRAAMIELIIGQARRFDLIRFDAAMTLAKRHFQRLWYPLPGGGAGIPSRERFALSAEQFEGAFPDEFWREVVQAVEKQAPQTLLVAEAFWMLEGFFVRDLGMHRVYNSAFMHMLRDGDNRRYREILRDILATDSRILQRFVNFMNNPDEATAVEQFGKGDKYFAVAVLLATLPGLPLFGHGQVEGLREKYGMEFLRPMLDEQADAGFFRHHQAQIFPLLRRRRLFAGAEHFHLFDLETPEGICEDVFAFCNHTDGESALVLVNNCDRPVHGMIRPGGKDSPTLAQALGLPHDCRWLTALEHHHGRRIWLDGRQLEHQGLAIGLGGFDYRILLDLKPDSEGPPTDAAEVIPGGWIELPEHP
ncbi:MAG: hypothetical protein Tsb0017_04230 [Geothermobacteraceae bacterium]